MMNDWLICYYSINNKYNKRIEVWVAPVIPILTFTPPTILSILSIDIKRRPRILKKIGILVFLISVRRWILSRSTFNSILPNLKIQGHLSKLINFIKIRYRIILLRGIPQITSIQWMSMILIQKANRARE